MSIITTSIRNMIITMFAVIAIFQMLYLNSYLLEKESLNIKNTVFQKVKNLSVTLQGSIEFLMRNQHEGQVKVKMSELGVNPDIKYGVLINPDLTVVASMRLAHIGVNVWEVLEGFLDKDKAKIESDINELISMREGRTWISDDSKLVVSVYPVAAFKDGDGLRQDKTGLQIIVHEYKKEIEHTKGVVYRIAVFQIVGLIGLALLLQFMVFRPLDMIREGAKKISSGNYDINIPLKGKGELSYLAREIESMSVKVNTGLNELKQQKKHINNLLGEVSRSEETFAKAQQIAHIGSWDWNIVSGELSWSDEIYRIFGLEPQEFGATYDAFLKSVHPEDKDIVIEAVNASVADANVIYKVEHRVIQANGVVRDVQEQGKVYRDEENNPIRMIGTVLDITERKSIMLALSNERNFINAVLESAGALVLVLDRQGRIIRFNHACEKISGYTLGEVKGSFPWDMLLPKENSGKIQAEAFDALINSEDKSVGFYTNHWVSKDGEQYLIDWVNSMLLDEEGNVEYVVAIGNDITEKHNALMELEEYRDNLELVIENRTKELKNTQDELIRKERLATLGQLTATVSHELRNPLGAMAPSLYIVKKIVDKEDERLQQAIERIERNIGRCDRIIDELLDYTRIGKVTLSTVVLDDWLLSVVEEQFVPKGVLLRNEFGLKNKKIMIDVNVLQRAVINVFDNACQAMQDESGVVFEGSLLQITTEYTNDKVRIAFKDNGVGMKAVVFEKIFEPLYSTKGFGVGLGMPTVKQIMEQHNGGVDVETRVNEGTVVTLWLPVEL